ncbi:MAG TPA: NAD(P)(+) transhydrogenase (Re/Si-specific) subunit beta [Mycobacteriales bacterium]|nr:NAD(P)(+) transhydrogenase (Re/Si-specific) subunit beta [Mycobacteriales bacterium]
MSAFETVVRLVYLAAAASFVIGLHLMNSPRRARLGNQISAGGMSAAVIATVALVIHRSEITATGWAVLAAGSALGIVAGARAARTVAMTAMPQLVSAFNAVGGGAAAAVGITEFVRLSGAGGEISTKTLLTVTLDVIIGAVTFSGSLIAAGKLQGLVTSRPVTWSGGRILNVFLAAVAVAGGLFLIAGNDSRPVGVLVLLAALAFGVAMVLPIGGADMPVVISLLNAFTGLAVAMAGFVVGSVALIIGGALVGASGTVLTHLMAEAMNRSVPEIMLGGFGSGDEVPGAVSADARVREIHADDAAVLLAYASSVVIVPGYGLAAAQAQHEVGELAAQLKARGVAVSYAIHPVAGRMPGHMNVLLAEADVPYTDLREMDEVNPDFPKTDVALVIGANDVTNPAARRAGNAVSGMPILDVDKAKSIIVIKRSMGHGYADIENELFTDPKTSMFFTDARAGLKELTAAIKQYAA